MFFSCDLPASRATSFSSGASEAAEWGSSWRRGCVTNCRQRLLMSMYISAELQDLPGERMQTGGLLKSLFSLHRFGNKTMTGASRRLRSWLDSIIHSYHANNGFKKNQLFECDRLPTAAQRRLTNLTILFSFLQQQSELQIIRKTNMPQVCLGTQQKSKQMDE